MSKRKGHPRMWCAPERVEWQHGLELRAVCLVIADNDDLMIQKYRQKYRHIPFAAP